ncbi:hypothetical protein QR680_014088 [Steinernema hermaphroditum]|uniref:Uncharacterized protein n=1 Tax=Steinernema hermaphroditum TaxID=289476 RepID=A0AA39I7M9_9BILA|nr:hypothetical protein QR680_014088 [Steinernema hermaphroditum]
MLSGNAYFAVLRSQSTKPSQFAHILNFLKYRNSEMSEAPSSHPTFDHWNYSCLCGLVHIKTGTASLFLITFLLAVARTVCIFQNSRLHLNAPQIIEICVLHIVAVTVTFGIKGLMQNNRYLLLPFLIVLGYAGIICFSLILANLSIIFNLFQVKETLNGADFNDFHTEFHLALIAIVWFFSVVCRCYNYFAALERFVLGDL